MRQPLWKQWWVWVGAVLLVWVLWDWRGNVAAERVAEEHEAQRLIEEEASSFSLERFFDGTIAACLPAYATHSVQAAVDACVQRAYAGTEDADEWAGISEHAYGCLERDWALSPTVPLNQGSLASVTVGQVAESLSACADDKAAGNRPFGVG